MIQVTRTTTIHCTRQVRELWPRPLARQWKRQYPGIFDRDDLRLAENQPRYHFNEWYAAIHIYQSHGALALLEKYATLKGHLRKRRLLERLLSNSQQDTLDEIISDLRVNPPDLLVYMPDARRFWFVEVKGPGDSLMPHQIRSHTEIRRRLKVPVQVLNVVVRRMAAA